ncbi:MAG: hypothetical protein U9R75_10075 [Candidatus Thermoplasmatota archaeon]|nr:hypothetical protein [Candidatus Thermoplasmatota archaeon]
MIQGSSIIAFNIALALRISRWTGYIPEELANDIDAFFLDVTILPETNPTGLRMWGEAEKDNYREIWRVANTPIRRYLPDLISSALGSGHGDPADMFARYLYLERWGNVDDLNMLDMRSPLEDKDLLSNRELSDHNDPYALKHHTSFPDPDGMQVSPRDRYDIDDNQSTLRFEPVIDSQYMIIGRDLFVKGLDSPKAWFTDADPENLKPSDLFAFGGLGTRCGAIPPPAKPPGHDYRLQWDLEITGDMELTASCEGYGGNVLNEGNLRKTISFDIPVRIHTWFDKRPSNDGFQFENINSGRMYWSDLMTGWSISEEANATEIFESKVFKELRPGFELLTSQLRSMEWNIGMGIMDTLNMRKVFQTQTMTLGKQLLTWSQDNLIWTNLDYFWMNHIKATEVQVEDLGTVRTDGHMITFTYSSIKDRLDLVSGLPGGQIRVSIFGVISGTRYIEAGLETSSGIRVDIYPTTGEFSIKGVLDEYYVDDGPLDPDEPSDDIKELIIRSGWIARGPSYDIRTWTTAGPYVEMDTSTMENSLSMSFLIAGENDNDMERIVSEAWGMLDDPGTIGETTSTTHLYEMGAFAVGRGLWFGISARSDGMDRTHPIARDLLIKVSDMGCLDHLVSTGSLGELVRDTIWGATTMDVQDRSMPYGRIDVIMIETVPSWVTSVPLDQGSADLMFVTHSSHINDDQGLRSEQGINLFSYPEPDGRYERGSDGWTSIEIELPTSLW